MKPENPYRNTLLDKRRLCPIVNLKPPKPLPAGKNDNRALRRALETSEGRLATARKRIASLYARNELLEQKLGSLARQVLKAYRESNSDSLTGLLNRRLLEDRFKQAVAHAERRNWLVVLIFLDIDNFKRINDEYGHGTGDRLLREVAVRLSTSTRKSDTVCRYGGDEFLIMIPDCAYRERAVTSANTIRSRLESPYVLDGCPIDITVSAGMAICPDDGEEFGKILQHSDRSMYSDKARPPILRMIR